MNKLYVIGAGPGSAEGMTAEAENAVLRADAVWCAARNDDLVPAEKRRPLTPFGKAMDEMGEALSRGDRPAVLLSGDTGLYSMLPLLEKRFGKENLRVVCGVSSLQILCARLKVSWQDTAVLSAHGRELTPAVLCWHVRRNEKTFVLLDAVHDPKWVRSALEEGGLAHAELIIGERLSYPDESVGPYEDRPYDSLSAAFIRNASPDKGNAPFGLKDESFIRGKTPMTKSEIRAQVIAGMHLAPDSIVWDVGAGTGSVSIECALQCPLGEVYAIERDEEALSLIERNKAAFRTLNIRVIAGHAPEALRDLPAPTHVFLGGTGGETADILKLLEGLGRRIRVCATAVTMESASLLTQALSRYEDLTASQIAVTRLEKAGRYTMFRAQNPVFVMAATMEGET